MFLVQETCIKKSNGKQCKHKQQVIKTLQTSRPITYLNFNHVYASFLHRTRSVLIDARFLYKKKLVQESTIHS